jgi:hypothetical protein
MYDAETSRTDLPRHDLPALPHLLVRAFRQKVHDGTPTSGTPDLHPDVSIQQVARFGPEGHSNALVRWSEHASPPSGSLN